MGMNGSKGRARMLARIDRKIRAEAKAAGIDVNDRAAFRVWCAEEHRKFYERLRQEAKCSANKEIPPMRKLVSGYWLHRLDTATHERRNELLAQAPGWKSIPTDRPVYAILDAPDNTGRPIDWHLLDSAEEASRDVREFRALERMDREGLSPDASEAAGLARMMGVMGL